VLAQPLRDDLWERHFPGKPAIRSIPAMTPLEVRVGRLCRSRPWEMNAGRLNGGLVCSSAIFRKSR